MATVIQVRPARSIGQAFGEGLQAGVQQGMKFGFQQKLQQDEQAFRREMAEAGVDTNNALEVAKYKQGQEDKQREEGIKRRAVSYREGLLNAKPPEERGRGLSTMEGQTADLAAELYEDLTPAAQTKQSVMYGVVPGEAAALTPEAATESLMSAMLLNPESLKRRYVTTDASGKTVLSKEGKLAAELQGSWVAQDKLLPTAALKELQLTPDEHGEIFRKAVTKYRALLADPKAPKAQLDEQAKLIQQHVDPTTYNSAVANETSLDPIQRLLRGEQVIPTEFKDMITETPRLFNAGNFRAAEENIAELTEAGYNEIALKLSNSPAAKGSRKESREQEDVIRRRRAAGRAEDAVVRQDRELAIQERRLVLAENEAIARTTDRAIALGIRRKQEARAQEKIAVWRADVEGGKAAIYVNSEDGIPLSNKPIRFEAALAMAAEAGKDFAFPVTQEVYFAEDRTLFVPADWDPTEPLLPEDIHWLRKEAANEGDPGNDFVIENNLAPIQLASIIARTKLAEAIADKPRDLTEKERAKTEQGRDLALRYGLSENLTPRQKTYISLLAPEFIKNIKVKGSLAAHVETRLTPQRYKSLIIAFPPQSTAFAKLKDLHVDAGDRGFALLADALKAGAIERIPSHGAFLSALDKEMDGIINPLMEKGLVVEEGQLPTPDEVGRRMFERLTGQEAPATASAAQVEPVIKQSSTAATDPGEPDGPAVSRAEGTAALVDADINTGKFANVIPEVQKQVKLFTETRGVHPTKVEFIAMAVDSGYTSELAEQLFREYVRTTKDTKF